MVFLSVSHILSALGLTFDLIGVLTLGYDLLRLQRSLRTEAKERVSEIKKLFDDLVPAGEWAAEIKDFGKRISSYSSKDDYQSDRSALGIALEEIGGTLDFIAVRIEAVAKLEKLRSERDEKSADVSFRLSAFGLVLILVGFFFQLVGVFLK
jgi:hypothetical protein